MAELKKCFKCKLVIQGDVLEFQEKSYHPPCLTCDVCSTRLLGAIYAKDDFIYCQSDYLKKYCKVCARCNNYITGGNSLEAAGSNYHTTCFTCEKCGIAFKEGDTFVIENSSPVCQACAGLICASCNGIITSGSYYTVFEHKFHPHCHKCVICSSDFKNEFIIFHEGSLYCRPDFEKTFPEINVQEVQGMQTSAPKAVTKPVTADSGKFKDYISWENEEDEREKHLKWMFKEAELRPIEAEILLKVFSAVAGGWFVYRTSMDRNRDFSLPVLVTKDSVKHFKILFTNGQYCLNLLGEKFDSIEALTVYYKAHPVTDQVCLTAPLEFPEVKTEVTHFPAELPPSQIEEYISAFHAASAQELIIGACNQLEQVYLTEISKKEDLAVVRRVLATAQATLKLLKSMLKDPARFGKTKFESEGFIQEAIASLEAKTMLLAAELEEYEALPDDPVPMSDAELDLLPPLTATSSEINLTTIGGSNANHISTYLVNTTVTQWLREFWFETKLTDRDGKMSVDNFLKITEMALPIRRPEVIASTFKENKELRRRAKKDDGLYFDSFLKFILQLFDFPHISAMFRKYARTSDEYMTILEFKSFLTQEQKLRNTERILRHYYQLTGMQRLNSKEIKQSHEVFGASIGVTKEGSLTLFGFANFLASQENSPFNPQHNSVYQDMRYPLNCYFINSSHNTYLEGDQLKSASSTEPYRKVLIAGCRCVELDLWDGPKNDPVIYHGYTLTSKVRARDVLETIAKYAFETSTYPLILSLENHMSLPQQKIFAQYCLEIFSEKIVPNASEMFWESDPKDLPSPEQLMGKILIKNKALSSRAELDNKKVAKELSDLVVYTKAVTFESLKQAHHETKCYEMCSIGEKKAVKLLKSDANSYTELVAARLNRTYPDGMRFDSSNPDPQLLWNIGCQMAALNFQTPDRAMQLNEGKFMQNGRCGYILKPSFLRSQSGSPQIAHDAEVPTVTVTVSLLAAFQLAHPRGKRRAFDPYVEIEIVGLNNQLAVSSVNHKVSDGCTWDETFVLTVAVPDNSLIRFAVMDEKLGPKDPIGVCVIPVDSLQQGYRHIPLYKPTSFGRFELIEHSSLFVNISISGGKPKKRENLSSTVESVSKADSGTLNKRSSLFPPGNESRRGSLAPAPAPADMRRATPLPEELRTPSPHQSPAVSRSSSMDVSQLESPKKDKESPPPSAPATPTSSTPDLPPVTMTSTSTSTSTTAAAAPKAPSLPLTPPISEANSETASLASSGSISTSTSTSSSSSAAAASGSGSSSTSGLSKKELKQKEKEDKEAAKKREKEEKEAAKREKEEAKKREKEEKEAAKKREKEEKEAAKQKEKEEKLLKKSMKK